MQSGVGTNAQLTAAKPRLMTVTPLALADMAGVCELEVHPHVGGSAPLPPWAVGFPRCWVSGLGEELGVAGVTPAVALVPAGAVLSPAWMSPHSVLMVAL